MHHAVAHMLISQCTGKGCPSNKFTSTASACSVSEQEKFVQSISSLLPAQPSISLVNQTAPTAAFSSNGGMCGMADP